MFIVQVCMHDHDCVDACRRLITMSEDEESDEGNKEEEDAMNADNSKDLSNSVTPPPKRKRERVSE